MFEQAAPVNMMPSCDFPVRMNTELEDFDINERVKGAFTYEVISKDEYGVRIKVKSLFINSNKRIE